MSLQVQIVRVVPDGNTVGVFFNVVPSGNYPTGGDTLDFSKAIADASFFGMAPFIPSSQGPVQLDVWDAGGNLANGVFPIMGTTQSNSKLKFTSAFNTELTAAAYPAPLLAAKLQGFAVFNQNV